MDDSTTDTLSNTTAAECEVGPLLGKLKSEPTRIQSLVTPYTASAVNAFLSCVERIKTKDDLISTLYQCRSAMRARKGGAIKVQPTSIARRRPGITRVCKLCVLNKLEFVCICYQY